MTESRFRKFPILCLLLTASLVATGSPAAQTTREFGRQTGYELKAHVEAAKLAILPLGSVEYHGPSGFSLTDSAIASGIAGQVAERVAASLLPVVNFTHSPAHTAVFRGTVSIRPEVATLLFTDILRGLIKNGFTRVLVLNGHDGNIGPARAAISQVTQEHPETQMVLISWWETLPTPQVEELHLFTSGNGGHGHGGPLELSVAAAFAPDSVQAGKGPDLPALLSDFDFPYYLEKSDVTGWPGYSGKLSEISAEKGQKLVDIAVNKISSFVKDWLENGKRPGSW